MEKNKVDTGNLDLSHIHKKKTTTKKEKKILVSLNSASIDQYISYTDFAAGKIAFVKIILKKSIRMKHHREFIYS